MQRANICELVLCVLILALWTPGLAIIHFGSNTSLTVITTLEVGFVRCPRPRGTSRYRIELTKTVLKHLEGGQDAPESELK
jgi:hypothetical protein